MQHESDGEWARQRLLEAEQIVKKHRKRTLA
jgi:hypothetical protein